MGTKLFNASKNMAARPLHLLIVMVLAFSPLLLARSISAVSDTTPMEFTSLTVSTNFVDVSNGVAQVSFVGPTQDDISGYDVIHFYYTSPSGNQVYEGDNTHDGEGTFVGTINFRQHAEPGVWRPTFTLIDLAGNVDVLDSNELIALGYNVNITVSSSTPDLEVPSLTAVNLASSTLDTGSAPASNQILATIPDNLTGQADSTIRAISPSGKQIVNGSFSSHDPGNNVYISNLHFPQYAETGQWDLELSLKDRAGNSIVYDASDLQANSLTSGFQMTGTGDTTPLSISELKFDAANPEFNDIPESGAAVTVRGNFSDNLSGISRIELYYRSQTSTQVGQGLGIPDPETNDNPWQITSILPPFSAGGVWLPELHTKDIAGNIEVLSHSDLLSLGFDLSINLLENTSESLEANQSISTDTEADGATPADPLEAAVTTPVEGNVSIVRLDLGETTDAANGYLFIGQQFSINAPQATAEAPLTLAFRIDASEVQPGQTAQDLTVFRNGVIIENCLNAVTADPDPCVFERNDLQDGDIEVKVHTSSASAWSLAFPINSSNYQFQSFHNPIKGSPVLNTANGGQAIPVKFSLGGDFGLNVLSQELASQQIDCSTLEPIGEATPTNAGNGQSLSYDEELYRYNWKTLKQWKGSCRQLVLQFSNGETVTAYFKFK